MITSLEQFRCTSCWEDTTVWKQCWEVRSQQRTCPSLDPDTRTPWPCTKACPHSHTNSAHCGVSNGRMSHMARDSTPPGPAQRPTPAGTHFQPTVDPSLNSLGIWPEIRSHRSCTKVCPHSHTISAHCVNPAVGYPGQLPQQQIPLAGSFLPLGEVKALSTLKPTL